MLVSILLSREKEESADSYSKPVSKSSLSSVLSLIKPWAIGCQINQVIEQQFMTFLWHLNLLSIHYVKVELGDTIPTIASLTCLGPAEYVLRTW